MVYLMNLTGTRTTVIQLQYMKVFLTQIYVFLVLFTFFDFYHEKFISKIRKKYVSTRNVYIWAKILSYIVVI